MRKNKIKLIIIDFYGVMTKGSYKETCKWLAEKYKLDYDYLYNIIYHKYFALAAVGKITEKQSFALPIKELNLKETWQELRKKHLSFQVLNKSVFSLCLKLQEEGYTILLLSKNTPEQFNYVLKKFRIRKYFKNIINTFDLGLPKSSVKTIKYVLKKYRVKPAEVIMTDDQDFNLVEPKRLGVKVILYKNFKDMKKELAKSLKAENFLKISGVLAAPGKAKGKVRIIKTAKDRNKITKGEIIVILDSNMKLLPTLRNRIAGFIIEKGNLTCHVATLAREMKIPCLVKVKNATRVLKNGDEIVIDGEKIAIFS